MYRPPTLEFPANFFFPPMYPPYCPFPMFPGFLQPPPPQVYAWVFPRRQPRPAPAHEVLPVGQVLFEELEVVATNTEPPGPVEEMQGPGQPDYPDGGNNIEPEDASDDEGGWEAQQWVVPTHIVVTEVIEDEESGPEADWDAEPGELAEPIPEEEVQAEDGGDVEPEVPEEGNNIEPEERSDDEGVAEPIPTPWFMIGPYGGTSERTKRRMPSNDGSHRRLRRRCRRQSR